MLAEQRARARLYLELRDAIDRHHTRSLKAGHLELPYRPTSWRRAHSAAVLGVYPELADTVRQIEQLSKL
jgi:hypothetical protein